MASKNKRLVTISVEEANENHMQLFRRLTNPIFNSGAMHGKPSPKVKKTH